MCPLSKSVDDVFNAEQERPQAVGVFLGPDRQKAAVVMAEGVQDLAGQRLRAEQLDALLDLANHVAARLVHDRSQNGFGCNDPVARFQGDDLGVAHLEHGKLVGKAWRDRMHHVRAKQEVIRVAGQRRNQPVDIKDEGQACLAEAVDVFLEDIGQEAGTAAMAEKFDVGRFLAGRHVNWGLLSQGAGDGPKEVFQALCLGGFGHDQCAEQRRKDDCQGRHELSHVSVSLGWTVEGRTKGCGSSPGNTAGWRRPPMGRE